MPVYSAQDASHARYLALINEGYAESNIDTWSADLWEENGENSYVYAEEDDDGEMQILCTVDFGDDSDATVTFHDGTVCHVDMDQDD